MYNYTLLYFEQKKIQIQPKGSIFWDKYSLDPAIPESWPGLDVLPSFACIPVPDTRKIPLKNEFLPDPVTGKPPSNSRLGGNEEMSFSNAVRGLGESGMKGLGLIANAIKSNNSGITKAYTFTFTHSRGNDVSTKHVISKDPNELMLEVMKRAYRTDITGVFCFTYREEDGFRNNRSTLLMILENECVLGKNISFLKSDFDKETVGSIAGVVMDSHVLIDISVVDVPAQPRDGGDWSLYYNELSGCLN